MRAVRINAFIFSALPVKNRTHYFAVINNIFDSFIASLSAFANFLN